MIEGLIRFLRNFYVRTAQPTFAEGGFTATINDKNDTEHTMMAAGTNQFAPRYPVFNATAPPLD